jgi:hypothetical protein
MCCVALAHMLSDRMIKPPLSTHGDGACKPKANKRMLECSSALILTTVADSFTSMLSKKLLIWVIAETALEEGNVERRAEWRGVIKGGTALLRRISEIPNDTTCPRVEFRL